MSPSCQAPSISPMALSMRCSSGRMAAGGGFGVASFFFFFFCAEAVEARDRLRIKKNEKKKARRAAVLIVKASFRNFMLDSLPKFEARFGCRWKKRRGDDRCAGQ